MDNKVYVDSEQLTSVAASIKVKANNILNIFQGDCSSAIILGKECLQVSGLDTTAIINSLNKIFTNLSTRINTLSDFLTQKVAGEYDLTSQSIINAFNGNFATELAALLGLTVGTTVVPGVTGNGAGTAGSTGGIATGIIGTSTGGSSGGCSSCQANDGNSFTINGQTYTKEQIENMSDEEILRANGYTLTGCNDPDGCKWVKDGKILPPSEYGSTADRLRKEMLSNFNTPTVSTGSSGNNNKVVSETPKETVTLTNETSTKTEVKNEDNNTKTQTSFQSIWNDAKDRAQEAKNNATVAPEETEKLNKAVVSGNKNEILAAQKDLDKATGKTQQTSFQTIWQSIKDDVNKTKKPVSEASDLDRAVISGNKNAIAAASQTTSTTKAPATKPAGMSDAQWEHRLATGYYDK